MVNGEMEEVCSITFKACCVRGGVIRANTRWPAAPLEVDAVKYSRVTRIGRRGKKDGEGQERQFNHGPATLRADDRLFGPQTL